MQDKDSNRRQVVESVRCYFMARDHLRRGICLLNAGRFDSAAARFSSAMRLNAHVGGLRQYLAQCHIARNDLAAAADEMAGIIEQDPDDVTARIRHAMLLWKRGDSGPAISSLRESLAYAPDCAEFHFQLGTLVAANGAHEEAELRFIQAVALDAKHAEAMVSLAMCYAARNDASCALSLLIRAQALRPNDARIGHLLSIACQAAHVENASDRVAAAMPGSGDYDDEHAVEELSRIIDADPEFIDAFIELPPSEVDEELHNLLQVAVDRAIARSPQCADLHYQHGRLLDHTGQADDAIKSIERALAIAPRSIHAMIQLARLYQKTDRSADATRRLEEALQLGVQYPDVYVLLGHLYRDAGRNGPARDAYRRAIRLNQGYEAAKDALEALPA